MVHGGRCNRVYSACENINEPMRYQDGMMHRLLIFAPPFCLLGFINDPQYLSDDRSVLEEQTESNWSASVKFVQQAILDPTMGAVQHMVPKVKVLQNTDIGEELFFD